MEHFIFSKERGRKGYVYTALTIAVILLSLSLISFYFNVYERRGEVSTAKISLEKLQYVVENTRREYGKTLERSGRRASTYAIDYILNSSQSFEGYEMQSCNGFKYSGQGSPAALSELMLCGTLFGEKVEGMKNNTLLNWTQKVEERFEKWALELKIRNLTLVAKDSWNFAVFSTLEISGKDKKNLTKREGNLSVTGHVSIVGLEDPLYFLQSNESDVVRKFQKCENGNGVDGSTIDEWIEEKCYHSSNLSYNGSSFFDRLEGNLELSPTYAQQHDRYFSGEEIGLESFINAYQWYLHNLTQYERNYTWVDYLFWQKIEGDCKVTGTKEYSKNGEKIKFWIDYEHKEKYNISGANCD